MAQTNKVTVRGNLTKDPEFKTLDNGKTSCSFSIAVNNNYEKDGQKISEPSYFTVKTYGEAADKMKEAKKGQEYSASGMVKQRTFEKDGKNNTVIEILAFDVNAVEKGQQKSGQSAHIDFAGNLAADPVFETFNSGKTKCSFTLINNNEYEKNGEKIKDNTAMTVELWGDAALSMKEAKKGNAFKIDGFLKQNRWDKDGVKHSTIKIQGNKIEPIVKKERKIPEPEIGM